MALFPGALPAAGTASASDTLAAAGHTSLHNTGADESRALGTKIGTGASTPTSGVVLRGNGTGTSAWGQVILTTDVTGVLPVANGGTGISSIGAGVATFLGTPNSANLVAAMTDETGSGSLVFGNSPTLTTPNIASFTNATHNHSNAAGGGQLTGSTALVNSTVTADKLATGAAIGTVDASETTNSTSYVQLATKTDTVTVTVGANGLALVVYGCDVANSKNSVNPFSYIAVAMTGANVQTAGTNGHRVLTWNAPSNAFGHQGDGYLATGLTPGSTTFTLWYKVFDASDTGTFALRHISVVPL